MNTMKVCRADSKLHSVECLIFEVMGSAEAPQGWKLEEGG